MTGKILSWNINGLRSHKTDIKLFLDNLLADVICFQETKVTRDMLEESYAIVEGYSSYFSFSKKRSGYSGVATFCKQSATPVTAQDGLSGRNEQCVSGGSIESLGGEWDEGLLKSLDDEGRCIITVHNMKVTNDNNLSVAIINVYCPRADPEKPERKLFKLKFYELLRQRAESLYKAGSHVIIVGDVNTSHKEIDHCEPDDQQNFGCRPDRMFLSDFFLGVCEEKPTSKNSTKNNASTTLNSSREEDTDHHSDFRVIDTFRYFHPDRRDAFTCWNTFINARATNYGTRIDYSLCNPEFIYYVQYSEIVPEMEGSDHCPIYLQLSDAIRFSPSDKPPPICTKYFPEYRGNQQKLHNYFQQQEKTAEVGNNKRKLNSSHKRTSKQTKLSSFFSVLPKDSNSAQTSNIAGKSDKNVLSECYIDSDIDTFNASVTPSPILKRCNDWNFLLKRPKSPPRCSGHNETSVLRTVRKKGLNFNKQFYACCRGTGRANDPNAQCNFFKWF